MNSAKEYVVSVESFEGPIDLLYQLITKRKLQINTVSLAKVTADYLRHTKQGDAVTAEEIAHFMHVASILILIKSKSLLDMLEYTEEEEVDVRQLEDRVRLFEYIREHVVPKLHSWRRQMYTVQVYKSEREVSFSPDLSCSAKRLHAHARAVVRHMVFLQEIPKKHVEKRVMIEEVIDKVLSAVSDRVSVSFRSMAMKDKAESIVSFLAVLELIKKNLLQAHQDRQFDDIMISKQTV